MFAYLAPIVSGVVFGAVADRSGWNMVFLLSIIFGLVGVVILAFIWGKPADGYEKVNRIIAEEKAAMAEGR